MSEPTITVNGVTLSESQAMAMRVAITAHLDNMSNEGALGDDEVGEAIRKAYYARSAEIVRMMLDQSPHTNLRGHELAMRAASKAYIEVAQQICGEGLEAAISAYLEVVAAQAADPTQPNVAWKREAIARIIDPHCFLPDNSSDDLIAEMVKQSKTLALRKAVRILSTLATTEGSDNG